MEDRYRHLSIQKRIPFKAILFMSFAQILKISLQNGLSLLKGSAAFSCASNGLVFLEVNLGANLIQSQRKQKKPFTFLPKLSCNNMVSHQEIEEITMLERRTLQLKVLKRLNIFCLRGKSAGIFLFLFWYHDETLHHKHVVFQANK